MNQSPKKRSEPAKKIGGGSLPLATASSPAAAVSSATPSNGGHPRNAPGKNEWKKVSLESVISILGDGLHGTPKYDDKGTFFFINGNNLRNGKIEIDENTKRTSENEYLKYKKNLNNRTLFVSINGTLGNIAAYNGEPVILGKSVCYFNVLESVDKGFIQYIILSEDFQKYINSLATGSTIKNVSLKLMRSYEFELPPFNIQRIISNILTSLDDKIALNHRINQTLEAMAQALFQSWFVDFDPVKAKQQILEAGGTARNAELAAMQIISGKNPHQLKTYQQTQPQQYAELEHTGKLFPNRLVESELGPVPEGWAVKTLGSLCSLITKGTTPTNSDIQGANDIPTVPYIKVKDISSEGEIIRNTLELIPESVHLGALKRSVVFENDILFSIAGSIGRIAVIDADLTNSNTNQAVGIIRLENKSMHFYWVLQSIKSKRIQDNIASKVVQGVQANTSLANLRDIQLIQPEDDILQDWNKHIDFLLDSVRMNQNEERMLVEIRDSLLPKLLSGEIDVSSLEIV